MPSPLAAPGFRRFLSGSVAALLAANAMAVATLLADDDDTPEGRLRDPVPTVAAGADPAAPVLVTSGDGDSFLADPTTAEGRAAIDEATRDGGQVHAITLPPGSVSTRNGAGGTTTSTDQLRTLLDRLAGGTDTGSGGGGTGGTGDGGGLLPIDSDLAEDLLDDTVTTVTSLLESTATTLTSVVESTATTLTSTVTTVLSTTDSTTGQLETTVTSLVEEVDQTVTTTLSTTCTLLLGC